MRISAFFLAGLILYGPVTASALVRPPLSTTRCPAGASSEAPPKISTLLSASTKQADAEKFLNSAIHCPNACYNLVATISLTYAGLQIEVVATHMCTYRDKLPNDPAQGVLRGCGKDEKQPSVTLITKDIYSRTYGFEIKDQTITKSRCNEEALTLSEKKFFEGMKLVMSDPSTGQNQMQSALNDLRNSSTPVPNTAEPPIPDAQLSQTLQSKFGVSETQANALVQSDADKIRDMISKTNTNDIAGAQQIAKQLNLNSDVVQNIAQMSPPDRTAPYTPESSYQGSSQQQSTFADKAPIERAKQAIANIESGGGNYSLLGPVTRTGDRAYGKYQVMGNNVGEWTQQALGYSMSPQQFLSDPIAQDRVFEYKFQSYADRYGSYEAASKVWFGGPGALSNPYRTDMLGTSVQRYGERFSAYYDNGQVLGGAQRPVYSSPFTGFSGGSTQTIQYSGSPFGSSNPFGSSYSSSPYNTASYGQSNYGSYGGYGGGSSQNSIFSLLGNLFQGLTGGNQPGYGTSPTMPGREVSYQQQPLQPVSSIIAQPQNATVGNMIVVSWSSVGMKTGSSCTAVMLSGTSTTTIGTSNEGSKIITADTQGILRFTLACTRPDGAMVEQVTAVAVH